MPPSSPAAPTLASTASTCLASTASVLPASRSSSVSPTQKIGVSPAARAAAYFSTTIASVSPKIVRRSEWPTIAKRLPNSATIRAETSPVYAPFPYRLTSWAPQAIAEPSRSCFACARYGYGTQTAHAAEALPGISRRSAFNKASLAARLPLSFQLPTTNLDRIPPSKPEDFTKVSGGASNGTLGRDGVGGVLDDLGDGFGQRLHVGTIFAFDHDAHDRLGARAAQQDAPAAGEVGLGARDRVHHRLQVQVERARELHVQEHLRKELELPCEVAERLRSADEAAQHLQRGDDRIARAVAIEAEKMPRVLAAAFPPALEKAFEHVAVADLRAHEVDSHLREAALEREVGHQRADHAALQPRFGLAVLHHRVEELVAVEERAVVIGHREAVAVAVEGDAEVRAVIDHRARHRLRVRGAALLVDVEAVGRAADRDHFRAELLEDARADAIVGAVRAIDDQLHAAQRAVLRERALAELEVTALGVVHALGLTQVRGGRDRERRIEQRLDLALDRVRELHAVGGEELDAVVVVRIVRGRDHHARREAQRAREERDRRCGHRSHQQRVDACRREPGFERGLEHVARDARVLADEDRGTRAVRRRDVCAREDLAGGVAELQDEIGRDGRLAHAAANAVGAEEFAGHFRARRTFIASTVSLTSWTRTSFAPFCTARRAAATLPARRSSTARPVISPMVRLRERPATTGKPSAARRGSARKSCLLCSIVLPKPKPGSIAIRPPATPARSRAAARSARKSSTSFTTSS